MTPAMVATWLLGVVLATMGGWWHSPWFATKLVLVVAMSGFHGWLGRCLKNFASERNRNTAKTYRIANEAPTLLVIAIVVLAVVKPF
jgi:putative membrane protein